MAQLASARRRVGFYLNLPELTALLQFRSRRAAFWAQYWVAAARSAKARFEAGEDGYFRIERDGLTILARGGELALDSHLMLEIMGDKALSYRLLSELGARAVPHLALAAGDWRRAEAFAKTHGWPVVVKPASGTGGGRGVTTGIASHRDLSRAMRYAARYDQRLIVEPELTGASHRLLFVGGRLVDAVRREAPFVVGDGVSSIKQLVRLENRRRLKERRFLALNPLLINPDFSNTLRRQKLSARHVPEIGEIIKVKTAINENNRYGNVRVTDEVSAETVAECSAIVTALGVQLAGVDVHCADISKPLENQGGYITEINTTPGLHHHALTRQVADVDPAAGAAVLDYMFYTGHGTMRLSADAGEKGSPPRGRVGPRGEGFVQ